MVDLTQRTCAATNSASYEEEHFFDFVRPLLCPDRRGESSVRAHDGRAVPPRAGGGQVARAFSAVWELTLCSIELAGNSPMGRGLHTRLGGRSRERAVLRYVPLAPCRRSSSSALIPD
jgi:hypothetical protein